MKKFVSYLSTILLIAACSTAFAGTGNVQNVVGNAGNPGIAPPQSMPYGVSYGEWSALWWQWVFALPVTENPAFLNGNVDLSLHQPPGPVWFLAGMMTATELPDGGYIGQAVRTGTVPAGKALFFPIINTENDNQTFGQPMDMTIPELRAYAKGLIDSCTYMDCEIDGVSVLDLWEPVTAASAYRATSPVFSYWLPATDNVQQSFGIDVSGTIGPGVADGST